MGFWRAGRALRLAVPLTLVVCAAAYAQMPWGFREGRVPAAFRAAGHARRQLHVLPRDGTTASAPSPWAWDGSPTIPTPKST